MWVESESKTVKTVFWLISTDLAKDAANWQYVYQGVNNRQFYIPMYMHNILEMHNDRKNPKPPTTILL